MQIQVRFGRPPGPQAAHMIRSIPESDTRWARGRNYKLFLVHALDTWHKPAQSTAWTYYYLVHPFNGNNLFSRTTWVSRHQKG